MPLGAHRQSNRLLNWLTDGFENDHCIGSECMGWRQFHLTRHTGSKENLQGHGYCAHPGKIELD